MRVLSKYKTRITLTLCLCTLFVLISIAKIASSTLSKTTKQVFADRAEVIVKASTDLIDGDIYEQFLKTLDPEDEWYQDICTKLTDLQYSSGCEYLYSMTQVQGYDFIIVLDGTPMDDEGFSPPGSHEDVENYGYGPLECMSEKRMIVADIDQSDAWGWTQSIYAPIMNSKGKVVGLVGCDFDATELTQLMTNAKMVFYSICMIGVFLIGLIILIILTSFFKRFGKVTNAIQQMTAGEKDLTAQVPVNHNNEISVMTVACNSLMENLRQLMINVKASTNTLAQNTEKIVEDSNQVAELTSNAFTNFNTISSKAEIQNEINNNAFSEMESVNENVIKLSENIQKQNEAVDNSYKAIQTITTKIADVDSNIQKIANEFSLILDESSEGIKKQDNVASLLSKIEEMSNQLTDANTVISSIAEQTNLLAMNAAIEAAHAGDEGRGFAVVADEIRKLAETSAEQTQSIERLITETRNSINQIVATSLDSSNTFNSLGAHIKKTGDLVQEIKNRIEEQNVQAENISGLMNILSEIEKEITTSSDTMSQAIQRAKDIVIESRKVSEEILDSSRQTSYQMENVQRFTAESAENSKNNQTLVNSLNETINQYKTER